MAKRRTVRSTAWAKAALGALLLGIGVSIGWMASEAQIAQNEGIVIREVPVVKEVTRVVAVTQWVEITARETVLVERVITATPLPTATPRPTSSLGTRENPAPVGEMLLFQSGDDILRVRIREVITGPEAARRVADANMFNNAAPDGLEFVLFYSQVTLSQTPKKEAVSVSDFHWTLVDMEGRLHNPPTIVEPEPAFNGRGYEGATIEGWVVHSRAVGEPALLVYGLAFNGTGGAWFAVPE